MRSTMTSYQARRHPFLAGIVLLIISPYVLAFALLFAAAFVLAAILDGAFGRH